jgi:hypothetical protein
MNVDTHHRLIETYVVTASLLFLLLASIPGFVFWVVRRELT